MRMDRWLNLALLVALCVSLVGLGGKLLGRQVTQSEEDPIITEVPAPDQKRSLIPLPTSPDLTAEATELASSFGTAVAVSPEPFCIVAVADRDAGRIHLFNEAGEGVASINDGIQDRSTIGQVQSLSFGPDGTLYATDLTWTTVSHFDILGERLWARRIRPMTERGVSVSDIAVGPDGQLFEYWLGHIPAGAEPRGPWDGPRPLVRVFNEKGELLATFGSVHPYLPSESTDVLTPVLNQGRVMMDADTLWVANRASAEITGYAKNAAEVWAPSRVVELPVFFRAPAAKHYARPVSDRYGLIAHPHIVDIDRVPGGGWIVLQATDYPLDRRSQPTDVVIAAYDNSGALLGTFRVQGRPIVIGANRRVVVLSTILPGGEGRRTLLLDNPSWDDSDPC